MNRRLIVVSLVALALAVPAFARVLSYAPYSNRTAMAGFHERTTRHFVLIESIDDTNAWEAHQVVLYDAKGIAEPRVVYPTDGSNARIDVVALYEPKDSAADPVLPSLLVFSWEQYVLRARFSPDGGKTWKTIADLPGSTYPHSTYESDFGGPSVQGMSNPIRTGNDLIPFIISSGNGIFGITATGAVATIKSETNAFVFGQNRAGTKFLVRTSEWIELIDINEPPPNSVKRLVPAQSNASLTGWITADGSAYIQVTHATGRYLFLYRNNEALFLMGRYNQTPPGPLSQDWPSGHWTNSMDFFAVPTHDFEGAWMLQRQAGKPTTLSRHTRPGGIQQMWSDVAGPEVEALIAGESGNTLLIQVHRDRSVAMQRPFIDPALAVWRVGEPMPPYYDELYLNEEWNKGFLHVDVDRMQEGAPFVFNSGATRDDGDIITSPSVGGGGDVIQEWGVVRATLRQHLVLPGVARLNGAYASRWLTDVTIYNPLDTPQNVDIRFVALGEEVQAASLKQTTITMQPNEIRFLPDALHSLFAIEDGGGALHFIPATGINVVGRTYSSRTDGGTFGFGMQAIDLYNAASPRFAVTFAGAFPGLNFRTNVLLTDTSGRGTEASLGAFGVSGPIGASTHTISAPPGGVLQFNGLGSTLNLFSRDAGGLVIQPTRGTAIATVVAIDNRTNDATLFPPDLPASEQIRAIPVIGHVDGANNSHFRSDIYLFNPTSEVSTVTLEAKQWDSPQIETKQFSLLPREARVIPDALQTLFGMTGLARLRYWSNTPGDGVRVTSRTYTLEESGATYGSLIPPLNNFQIASPGDDLEILGINGGTGFRTNIGLVELSGNNLTADTSVRITLYDQNRTQLGTFTVTVPRSGGMQINDIFAARGITPPEAGLVVVRVQSGGLIGAYATLVDNITNDTTYLGAQLGAKEN
ncbi:MAG TPA: hypothetical protein VGQ76_05445 [Thermoanaerobaculia bacterium]|jgi:hypothetical protein|nr:hypothetical protein [Thermoanaerobaculia bacterium]